MDIMEKPPSMIGHLLTSNVAGVEFKKGLASTKSFRLAAKYVKVGISGPWRDLPKEAATSATGVRTTFNPKSQESDFRASALLSGEDAGRILDRLARKALLRGSLPFKDRESKFCLDSILTAVKALEDRAVPKEVSTEREYYHVFMDLVSARRLFDDARFLEPFEGRLIGEIFKRYRIIDQWKVMIHLVPDLGDSTKDIRKVLIAGKEALTEYNSTWRTLSEKTENYVCEVDGVAMEIEPEKLIHIWKWVGEFEPQPMENSRSISLMHAY